MAVDDFTSVDLEVPYENDCVRMVINDELSWDGAEQIDAHFVAIKEKIRFYISVAESVPFRQRNPNASLNKLSIALRFLHSPPVSADDVLEVLAKELAAKGVKLIYGHMR